MEKEFITVLESIKHPPSTIEPPLNLGTPESDADLRRSLKNVIDWNKIHPALSPDFCLPASRATRKKLQLEAMILGFKMIYDRSPNKNLEVVDFCCGAGHVGLLLAAIFPSIHVQLVEWNKTACKRAYIRRMLAGLTNVSIFPISILDFPSDRTFDVGVGLHACGWLTDECIRLCLLRRSSFVVCPCCTGKLNLAPPHTRETLPLPRSRALQQVMNESEFVILSKAGDHAHVDLLDERSNGIISGGLGVLLSQAEVGEAGPGLKEKWGVPLLEQREWSSVLDEPCCDCEDEGDETSEEEEEEEAFFGRGLFEMEWGGGRQVLSAELLCKVFGEDVLQQGVAGKDSLEWRLSGLPESRRLRIMRRRAVKEEKKKEKILAAKQKKQMEKEDEEVTGKAQRGNWTEEHIFKLRTARRACKRLVDYDRLLWCSEKGTYDVVGWRMDQQGSPKSDILVGFCKL
eukprot:GDKJ01029855.1.p1 GENE.GDKJ01029855.1~~GDKJ01029855.1.p1  ORF type:complete len:467 (-),score=79.96 GDKJ01029855.1:25-1398(-)